MIHLYRVILKLYYIAAGFCKLCTHLHFLHIMRENNPMTEAKLQEDAQSCNAKEINKYSLANKQVTVRMSWPIVGALQISLHARICTDIVLLNGLQHLN